MLTRLARPRPAGRAVSRCVRLRPRARGREPPIRPRGGASRLRSGLPGDRRAQVRRDHGRGRARAGGQRGLHRARRAAPARRRTRRGDGLVRRPAVRDLAVGPGAAGRRGARGAEPHRRVRVREDRRAGARPHHRHQRRDDREGLRAAVGDRADGHERGGLDAVLLVVVGPDPPDRARVRPRGRRAAAHRRRGRGARRGRGRAPGVRRACRRSSPRAGPTTGSSTSTRRG